MSSPSVCPVTSAGLELVKGNRSFARRPENPAGMHLVPADGLTAAGPEHEEPVPFGGCLALAVGACTGVLPGRFDAVQGGAVAHRAGVAEGRGQSAAVRADGRCAWVGRRGSRRRSLAPQSKRGSEGGAGKNPARGRGTEAGDWAGHAVRPIEMGRIRTTMPGRRRGGSQIGPDVSGLRAGVGSPDWKQDSAGAGLDGADN